MANNYNNFRPTGDGSQKGFGSFKGGFNGREQRVQNADQQNYVKRSGCGMKDSYIHKSGEKKGQVSDSHVVFGWKVAPGGAGKIKFVAVQANEPETKNPRWLKMVCTVTPPIGNKFLTNAFWDKTKQRLHLTDMELIANPNAPNGGYFGRNYKPKN